MISIELITELGLISKLCKHSYTEIINSFLFMTRWINLSKTAMCIRIAVEHWLDINASIAFNDYYLSTKLEEYPNLIHDDISFFAGWCIYNGADGASVRRILPTKIQDYIRKVVRKHGVSVIITMLWRSLIAFQSITDKCIIPAYKECLKHVVKDDVQFGQVKAAFAQLKNSA